MLLCPIPTIILYILTKIHKKCIILNDPYKQLLISTKYNKYDKYILLFKQNDYETLINIIINTIKCLFIISLPLYYLDIIDFYFIAHTTIQLIIMLIFIPI